jgi:hypothetical protein
MATADQPSPSQLSIVGPRYSGKSVFLGGLAAHSRANAFNYAATVAWDLGHLAPASDAEFIALLSRKLGGELRAVDRKRFGTYADVLSSGAYGDLHPVHIGVMDETDVRQALAHCRIGEIRAGAETEIRNWSGSYSPLLLALLNAVEGLSAGEVVRAESVNAAAADALADRQEVSAHMSE